jgi:hypothetical protein
MSKPTIPPGTLVLWKNKYLRTVISSSPGYVKFAIRRRSWTNRARTTYIVAELLAMGCKFLNKKTKLPILKSEALILKSRGFDIRKELKRELAEAKSEAKRLNRPLCAGHGRLERLVK